ncbi:MAG: transketolase C-terminal domain-containing protein [Polyangiaceae bacterium]
MSGKVRGFTWTVEDVNLISENEIWGDVLVELAAHDPRIVALSADLAHSTKLRRFKETFPERYFNVGIAEQNLVAVAAGLAAMGLTPVACTYATFATLRAAEFVRTDLAYNRRNVKLIGTLAGVAFGQGGPTHHAVEDIALMRAIPGMTVLAPCDGFEMGAALRAALTFDGPVYLRTGRCLELPVAERKEPPFAIGAPRVVRAGSDLAVLAHGNLVGEALRAAERMARAGVSVRVVNVSTLKPLGAEAVLAAVQGVRAVITAEDHSVIGGLGSAVAEVLAEHGSGVRLKRLGHPDRWLGMGVTEDLMHSGGFDEDAIVAAVEELSGARLARDETWPTP